MAELRAWARLVLVLAAAMLATGCASSERAPEGVFTRWKTWTRADGLPGNTVWAVLPGRGGVWVGTTSGLAFYNGASFRVYGTKDGLVHRAVTSLAIDPADGALWIGTFGGVSRFDGMKFTNYTQASSGLVNDVVYAVAVQGRTVWMGTANGLSGLDKSTGAFTTYDDRNAPFQENWCYGATVFDGKLYLSVWGGGLCIRDGATGRWETHLDPDGDNRVDLLANDGIPSDIVAASSAGEDGRVWIASYFGVGMYDGRRWKAFSTANSGLPRNFVNTVKASGAGCWAGTDSGLCHYDGKEAWAVYRTGSSGGDGTVTLTAPGERPRVIRLEGAPGSNFIWSVAEEIHGRKLWVGTARGLSLAISGEASL